MLTKWLINSKEEAVDLVLKLGWIRGPEKFMGTLFGSEGGSIFMMFKREYYKSFSSHFPEIKKEDGNSYGYGQIMSREVLDWAFDNQIDWIAFVTPDRKVYKLKTKLFKEFVDKYNTEVPHLKGEVAIPLGCFEAVR